MKKNLVLLLILTLLIFITTPCSANVEEEKTTFWLSANSIEDIAFGFRIFEHFGFAFGVTSYGNDPDVQLSDYPAEHIKNKIPYNVIDKNYRETHHGLGIDILWFPFEHYDFYIGAGAYLYEYEQKVQPQYGGDTNYYKIIDWGRKYPFSIGYQRAFKNANNRNYLIGLEYHSLRGYSLLTGVSF